MKCRHCRSELSRTFIDLGDPPPSNAYLTAQTLHKPEKCYPLKVLICGKCWLVQTEDFLGADELFSDEYAYFSSFSTSWLNHARDFVENAVTRFELGKSETVVEIAANDGYLLQYVMQQGIPCYGIEPTRSTAKAARQKGLDIIEEFFGNQLADQLLSEGRQADLLIANNVLAHVPDINDFVAGVSALLKPRGTATFEFPHLLNLVQRNQFDTIYHEHYSYLSLTAVLSIFSANNLTIFDVDELSTHGGSLRVYANRADSGIQTPSPAVKQLLEREIDAGVNTYDFYGGFQERILNITSRLKTFLIDAKNQGKKVAGYGAAAKGNTLLNHSSVDLSLISFVADRNPAKQGMFMPGSHIPILGEAELKARKPDFVLILPWNLKDEVMSQLSYIRDWGGEFVTAIPELERL
jgi:SAM-dependent methyltransferase